MERGSPSEIDNYSVNEKNSPYCMETENVLPYYQVYQDMPLNPYPEQSELSPRFH